MKKINIVTILATALLSVFAMGCDESDSSGKYTLSEVVPEPVPVVISGDIGILQFELSAEPLTETEVDAFTGYLTDGTFDLVVTNEESGVSYSISEGTLVEGEPMAEGEYSVAVVDDLAEVLFWNDFNGVSIRVDGDYMAAVTVMENDHFTTESFTVDVAAE